VRSRTSRSRMRFFGIKAGRLRHVIASWPLRRAASEMQIRLQ
jgi:hypothetical protein